MADQIINLSFSIKEFFDFIPEIAANTPVPKDLAEAFKDKEFSMVFELDNEKYSVISKNITDIRTENSDMDAPMVRVNMTMDDLTNLIKIENARLFAGQAGLISLPNTRLAAMYDKVSTIQGAVAFELTNSDNTKSLIHFKLNNQDAPSVGIKMSIDSFRGIVSREDNPVNLFMSGRITLEGDMAFAMSLQSLFT